MKERAKQYAAYPDFSQGDARDPGLYGRQEALDGQLIHRAALTVTENECVHMRAFETGTGLRTGFGNWIGYVVDVRFFSYYPAKSNGLKGAQDYTSWNRQFFLVPAYSVMKAVILAGGLGTRLSEETHVKPKPMVEIGGRPIIWHIMKIYSAHGVTDFIICCGYKGYMIKEYFSNYFLHMSDVTIDIQNNSLEVHRRSAEPWRITLVDTGEATMTGGRLRRVRDHLANDSAFCFTYGDGVSDIDVTAEIAFHRQHGRKATIAAVRPPGRYGALQREGNSVVGFTEKPRGDGGYINGGFFVLSPSVVDLIAGDSTSFEAEPLTELASTGELMAFEHEGFWQPMDTQRDRMHLEALWASGKAPWRVW